jgi:predicted porin
VIDKRLSFMEEVMKKILMGSTAIAALGLVAAPAMAQDGKIALSVGGYYQNFVSYVDQDEPAGVKYNEVNVRHEGEIIFSGETTLDNGLTVGFQAQLEAITQGDQMDETYMYFEGGWGRTLLGSENSAPYLMAYAAPSAGLGVNSPNFYLFSTVGSAPTSGYLNATSDANKITYFTPRFGGFQLGVSYTPNIDSRGGNRQAFNLNTDNDEGDLAGVIGVGANFVESFNGIDVAVSGGYEYADNEAADATPATGTAFDATEDYDSWSVGANIGYAGFTVGGSYNKSDNGMSQGDATFWDAGVSYGTGPWAVSFTYANSEQENGAGAGDDERDQYEVGATYKLSPGVSVVGSLQYFDENNDSTVDIDGWGAAVGTKLSF